MTERPLLFLDVDGPLIPFGHPGGYPGFWADTGGNPLLARIDPGLGRQLTALPGELVWATTWMGAANESVVPLLGLPSLPVVDFPEPTDLDRWYGLHWKTRALCDWAASAGRPSTSSGTGSRAERRPAG